VLSPLASSTLDQDLRTASSEARLKRQKLTTSFLYKIIAITIWTMMVTRETLGIMNHFSQIMHHKINNLLKWRLNKTDPVGYKRKIAMKRFPMRYLITEKPREVTFERLNDGRVVKTAWPPNF
jgi:hypothetical protein